MSQPIHDEHVNTNIEEHVDTNTEEQRTTTKLRSTSKEFDILTKKWIRRSVQLINLERLNSKLLPIIPHLEEDIREAHAQGLIYMETELQEALDEKIKETDLIDKMNKMDTLIREAKRKEPTEKRMVPTPEQVARGAICEAKDKEAVILSKELDNIKNENKLLMERLSNLKNELTSKRKNITQDIEKFKKATTIASTIPVEDLILTMKELDMYK